MKVRDLIRLLEEDGWNLLQGTVTVAGHPGVDIPPGTLNAILKQSGLKE